MSDELVELDFCCPECNCSEWRHDKHNGVYSCARCDYVVAFDEDDPDYDEMELCSKCHGKGVLTFGGVNYSCTLCDGRGSL
ncbi:MAG: hypothetical protein V7L25_30920 [Nostoc sp.]|uniref:hypothetical protein n=1 Tax=Nostoc sp. TaxID=1180 RepID=UPI002FF1EB7A